MALQKCSYVWRERNNRIVSTFSSFIAKWKIRYNKNPWWVRKFESFSRSCDYQQQIFWLSWNLETYIYKSRSESWMYECFASIGNIVNDTFYKCKSWKNVLLNGEHQNPLKKLFRLWSTGLFAKNFWRSKFRKIRSKPEPWFNDMV